MNYDTSCIAMLQDRIIKLRAEIERLTTEKEFFRKSLAEANMQPHLGCATTRHLLEEISARFEMDGRLEYRTIDQK